MASHGVTRTRQSRTVEQQQADREKIARYRELDDKIHVEKQDPTRLADPEFFQLTTKLLRLNPEYYTIWNVRRACLISGSFCRPSASSWPSKASRSTSANDTTKTSSEASSHLSSASIPPNQESLRDEKLGKSGISANGDDHDPPASDEKARLEVVTSTLQSELIFTIPLLLEFPKCYWIWNHRSWLLEESIALLPTDAAREIWQAELALASKMLTKDRRNFHAWSYRRSVVDRLESKDLDGSSMAESEFEYTTKMIRADLSNFSAWHNRTNYILRVLEERQAGSEERKHFLLDELRLAQEGLNVGPEDQSLWYYHQFLMNQIAEPIGRATIAPTLTLQERVEIVEKEIVDIKDLLEDYDDIKWIYEVLLEYSMALEKLLKADNAVLEQEDPDLLQDQKAWLTKLRIMDPKRNGRWDDVEMELDARPR